MCLKENRQFKSDESVADSLNYILSNFIFAQICLLFLTPTHGRPNVLNVLRSKSFLVVKLSSGFYVNEELERLANLYGAKKC